MKTPKASGALRRAPDPTPRYARFARPTPLRYVSKIGQTRAGAPPLTKSWIRYCIIWFLGLKFKLFFYWYQSLIWKRFEVMGLSSIFIIFLPDRCTSKFLSVKCNPRNEKVWLRKWIIYSCVLSNTGEHEIKVIVRGNGSLARLLYSMVKHVNHTKEIDIAEDNFSKNFPLIVICRTQWKRIHFQTQNIPFYLNFSCLLELFEQLTCLFS